MRITDTNTLKELIIQSGKKNILFDFFDTIVHRRVHPEDIKRIACDRLLKYFQLTDQPGEFLYQLRAEIERELCLRNQANGFDLEFHFDQMVATLYERLNHVLAGIPLDFFARQCREEEITAELSNQYADASIIKCIRELHAEGFNIYCCSDIYLDEELMSVLMSAHGIEKYFSKIFVSSAYCLTKRSGRLYGQVMQFLDPETCIMIGDNYESDYLKALENTIQTIHIDRTWAHGLYEEYKVRFRKNGFQNNIAKLFDSFRKVHFKEFSLTSFYFIQLLYLELKRKGFKEVFFLAREGQVLKYMFDVYQEICAPSTSPAILSHYLMVSRRSTFLPSLEKLEKEVFFNLFRQYRRISTQEFLFSLGFDAGEITQLSLNLNIDPARREEDFPTSESYIRLMISDEFYSMYESRRRMQKQMFKQYFHSFSSQSETNVALVDVGWKGTIQDNIYKILDCETAIHGFYIGLVIKPEPFDPENTKEGLLFSAERKDKYYGVFDENRSFFEAFFAADHGSAISYDLDEYGEAMARTEDFSEEEKFFKIKIYPLINCITAIYKDICMEYRSSCIDERQLRKFVARNHARMFLYPTREELDWHMNMYHVENFGVFERNQFSKRSGGGSLFSRLRNYYYYKKNPEKFVSNGIWPASEFAKHGLSLSLKRYSNRKFSSIFN